MRHINVDMNLAGQSVDMNLTGQRAFTYLGHMPFGFRGRNVFHAGFIAEGRRPGGAKPGELCEAAMESGTGNYLANLVLYPGTEDDLI